jgi:toxin-antitoxin system PIN domain toxin
MMILASSGDLLDANLWLALAAEAHSHHSTARDYWESAAAPMSAFCWVTQMAFLRLLTNRTVMGAHTLSPSAAWDKWMEFRALPEVQFLAEPDGLDQILGQLCNTGRSSPNLWIDAYLAAFARSSGLRLVTFDKGFSKFSDLECLIL